jgi:hypothetical protein
MANIRPFLKGCHDEPSMFPVKCTTDVTDTRLAYKLLTTDHETAELCGDGDAVCGHPDKTAKAGEAFNLRGGPAHIIAVGRSPIAINDRVCAGATGGMRKAVAGVDFSEGVAESPVTNDGDSFTYRKGC